MLFEIITIVAVALIGGAAIAWAIETILPIVINRLKELRHDTGIVIKGTAINKWIKKTNNPIIRSEAQAVRDAGQALLLPLDNQAKICYKEITVLKPEDVSGEDRMANAVMIDVDGSHYDL